MTKFIVFCTVLFNFSSLFANDSLSIESLSFLNGNWQGVLQYTDYADDKTQVRLQTHVNFASRNGIIEANYTYQEPDKSMVYHESIIKKSSKDRHSFRFDEGVFNVIEQEKNHLLLSANGEDNSKKATIYKKIEWDSTHLTITKSVKYDGSDKLFTRNTYQFERESASQTQERLLKTLIGTWTIDLRPSATDAPYLKDFVLTSYKDKSLSGIFYDTAFEGGKIHTEWGKIYFSFTTGDNSGTYFHSGYIEKGRIYGTSFSEGRGFIMPWFGIKKL